MKKTGGRLFSLFLISIMAMGITGGSAMAVKMEQREAKEVNVVFTHDLHSRLKSFYIEENGQQKEVGGYARMMTFLKEKRAEDENLLFLDGGDFSMGTLYQTVYETEASELRLLGHLGVDVTTLGNHEFDYRSKGLSNMLAAAKDSGDRLPPLVLCNVDWEATLESEKAEEGKLLREAFEKYGIKPYTIVEKGDVRIAVIGVFGKDSLACAPTCALTFKEPIEAVKETVKQIQEEETVDMIACVSHSGTWEEPDKSEDELLAKAVPELDLIVSGHTHSTLEEPIIHGNTAIVSTGEYGARIGSFKMVEQENGRWKLQDYALNLLDNTYAKDEATEEKIEELGKSIDGEYLAQFGYTKDQVLTYNPWQFSRMRELGVVLQEETLGNLLADSYLYVVNNADTGDENPATVAVVPSGCIRDTFYKKTNITVSDAFQTLSLGIGPDGVPGYPLISIYLTGEELKTMAEVDASISPIMTTAQLYTSGITYTLNPNRLILNKVTDIDLQDMTGNTEDLQDEKLYRVVADLYSGQMLGAVSGQSFGILSVTPKDAEGNEIPMDKLEDYIVYRNGQEVKAWVCVADYLDSFEKTGGKSVIPEYYSTTHERKIIDDDSSIGAIVKNPNKLAVAMVSIAVGVVILLIIIIVLIVKLVKRVRRKHKNNQ